MQVLLRRVRGIAGNALVWGAAWFVMGFAMLAGVGIVRDGIFYLPVILGGAIFAGIAGGMTGAAFSAYVLAVFRRAQLEDLHPLRFALGGGLVSTFLGLVYILATSRSTSLWPLQLGDVIPPALVVGAIGTITAFGSIRLAQKALVGSDLGIGHLDSKDEARISGGP